MSADLQGFPSAVRRSTLGSVGGIELDGADFAGFQGLRAELLGRPRPPLDLGETNLYRALGPLRPALDPDPEKTLPEVHRCDLARAWLARAGLPAELSRRAMVTAGVRHGLAVLLAHLHQQGATLWAPSDVYPVYLDLAAAAGVAVATYPTLPSPDLPVPEVGPRGVPTLVVPATAHESALLPVPGGHRSPTWLLAANPWKPLGRFLTEAECTQLIAWLAASPERRLILDTVYDLGSPEGVLHPTTRRLFATGQAVVLHSVTKGWLWPRTFGVALLPPGEPALQDAFRIDSPDRERLRRAACLLGEYGDLPAQVVRLLAERAEQLIGALPAAVASRISPEARSTPGNYLFPVDLPASDLLADYGVLAIPGSAFGARAWRGSILSSLAVGAPS